MVKTARGALPRVGIRLPKPMMDEVDRVVEDNPDLVHNRQQFVESAVREKIEATRRIGRGEVVVVAYPSPQMKVIRFIDRNSETIAELSLQEPLGGLFQRFLDLPETQETLKEKGVHALVKLAGYEWRATHRSGARGGGAEAVPQAGPGR